VRGELLEKFGRVAEARTEFQLAAEMTGNARERSILLDRAEKLGSSPSLE
jgi:predicted RNA polymerase sigma factor